MIAAWALVVFAATMGFDLPAPPVPAHAAWADVALLVALTAIVRARRQWLLVAPYVAWIVLVAIVVGSGVAWVLGALALGGLYAVTATVGEVDRIVRAWIVGAVVLSIVGLATGIAAQLGVVLPLHRGDGELGLAFRPAGLQRVGLLAELCVVPLLVTIHDGKRLLARWRWIVGVILAVTLLAGMTRSLLGVALGIVVLRVRGVRRVVAIVVLVAAMIASLRLDVHGSDEPGIRWRIATATVATIRAHPIVGIGPSGDLVSIGWPHAGDVRRGWDAHCTLLDLAGRAGIPAAILFAAIVATVLRRRTVTALDAALCAGLWATVFDSLAVDVEHFRHVWLLLGLYRRDERADGT